MDKKQLLEQLDNKLVQDNAGLSNQHYLTYHFHFPNARQPYDHLFFAGIGKNSELEFVFYASDIPDKDSVTKFAIRSNQHGYLAVLQLLLQSKPFVIDALGNEIK